jgi:serine protease
MESGRESGIQRVKVPAGGDAAKVLALYKANPLVAEAGFSRNARILDAPNDPNFSYQWHLRSTDGGMWADIAWDLAANDGAGVTVAVIDTGVAYEAHNGSLEGTPQTFAQATDLASTT